MRNWFDRAAERLASVLKLEQAGKGKQQLHQELSSLSGGRHGYIREYYFKKMSLILKVLTAGCLLSAASGLLFWLQPDDIVIVELERPGYGEADRTQHLQVQMEGEGQLRELDVKVSARNYTDLEKQRLLDQAVEQLDQEIVGTNESMDEVRQDLVLPEYLMDGAVELSWATIPYGVVDTSGRLTGAKEKEGTLVELQGTLTCGERELTYTAYANVFPPETDEETKILEAIREEAELADIRESHRTSVVLPKELDGRKLTWSQKQQNPFFSVLAVSIVLAVCLYIQMDNEVHKKAEERKQQLMMDYPDFMWKMTMLLGAGLSIRGTFERISGEYLREKQKETRTGHGRKKRKHSLKKRRPAQRYLYEEVMHTCMEMKSGISEASAYERFGTRCQLPEYIRLGTVLSQNLKKGSKGLIAMLETEAEASLTERRNHARQIGEKAGTKLLLPMILMLGVVLAVLMVPALMAF